MGGHRGEYADHLRVQSRIAERQRWQAARNAKPDLSLDEHFRASKEKLEEIDLIRRLLFPPPSHELERSAVETLEAFLEVHRQAVVLDITVSRWGTVVLTAGGAQAGSFAGTSLAVLPTRAKEVFTWVHEFSTAYEEYLAATPGNKADARVRWAAQTDAVLASLSTAVVQPCLGDLRDTEIELIISAGLLAGLPLHAAQLTNGLCTIDAVGSCTYIPNVAVLTPAASTPERPESALLVMSDLKDELTTIAHECNVAASHLKQLGTNIQVLARIGDKTGSDALAARGVQTTEGVRILPENPSPELVCKLLPQTAHFLYSGHGVNNTSGSGLVLVGSDSNTSLLTEDDILSMNVLMQRPVVVLSACETAMGGRGSAELFDVASSFLRVGARYVVATQWLVVEDCASTFITEFYTRLAAGKVPEVAFSEAVRALKRQRRNKAVVGSVPPDHPVYWAPFVAMRGA